MLIGQIVFYFFAALLLISATMVIVSRQPVRGVLFLILAFFSSSVLWLLLQAEFLGLVLIFVYIGAVMTLFLFVVMMLDLDQVPKREKFVRYLPFGLIVMALLVGMIVIALKPQHFLTSDYYVVYHSANYSNVQSLGSVLYTQYLYPFEIAAVLLLVAIISAICLAHQPSRTSKMQRLEEQHRATKESRLRLINLKSERP